MAHLVSDIWALNPELVVLFRQVMEGAALLKDIPGSGLCELTGSPHFRFALSASCLLWKMWAPSFLLLPATLIPHEGLRNCRSEFNLYSLSRLGHGASSQQPNVTETITFSFRSLLHCLPFCWQRVHLHTQLLRDKNWFSFHIRITEILLFLIIRLYFILCHKLFFNILGIFFKGANNSSLRNLRRGGSAKGRALRQDNWQDYDKLMHEILKEFQIFKGAVWWFFCLRFNK